MYKIFLRLPDVIFEDSYFHADNYSIFIPSPQNILIFNHAIKAISGITSNNINKIIQKDWRQNSWFEEIINLPINITFIDGEIINCCLTYYLPDKLFTNHSDYSMIQKGSIAFIKK